MLVKEIMTRGVEAINPDATVVDVAKKMRSLNIGSLPVQEGDEIQGIVSKKDIVFRCIAEDWDAGTTPVSEIMTTEIATCYEGSSIEEAAHILEEKQLHRLLVLDSEDNLCGIFSLSDIAVKSHSEHLSWEVLEHISEPACPRR